MSNKPVTVKKNEGEPDPSISNLITATIAATVSSLVAFIVANLRVDATFGLGEYEATVQKERMKMPRYSKRRVRHVDG